MQRLNKKIAKKIVKQKKENLERNPEKNSKLETDQNPEKTDQTSKKMSSTGDNSEIGQIKKPRGHRVMNSSLRIHKNKRKKGTMYKSASMRKENLNKDILAHKNITIASKGLKNGKLLCKTTDFDIVNYTVLKSRLMARNEEINEYKGIRLEFVYGDSKEIERLKESKVKPLDFFRIKNLPTYKNCETEGDTLCAIQRFYSRMSQEENEGENTNENAR